MKIQATAIICNLLIPAISSNGFDLNELIDEPDHPITTDLQSLSNMEYTVVSVLIDAYGKQKSYLNPTRYLVNKYTLPPRPTSPNYLSRMDKNKQDAQNRKRPQYTISFKDDFSIFLFVAGTSSNSPHYDVKNLNNAFAKEIALRKFSNQKIEVHSGMFSAVNTETFFVQLLDDLDLMIERAHKNMNGSKKLFLSGYSQGGALVTLLSVLWKGRADCDFVGYFEENASQELKFMMDKADVITVGGCSSIANTVHGANFVNDKFYGKIINIINVKDVVPMGFNGVTMKPDRLLREDHGLITDIFEYLSSESINTFAENYNEVQWYGPVGNYMVVLPNNNGQIVFRNLDSESTPELYQKHLVHGGYTLSALSLHELQLLWLLWQEHVPQAYVNRFSAGIEYYKNKLQGSYIDV